MTHPQPVESDSWVDERLATLAPAAGWQPNATAHLPALHLRRASQRAWRLRAFGAAAAAVVVLAAVPVTRAFGSRCLEACVSGVSQLWRAGADEPLANAPKLTGFELGSLAPDLAGTDESGRSVSLVARRGHVIVLNFWATWCGPCRGEIPVLNSLAQRYGAQGLDVIGVSLDQDGWTAIKSFTGDTGMNYDVVLGSADIATTFGVMNVPATFIIDPDGVIVARMVGVMREGQYDRLIEKSLR